MLKKIFAVVVVFLILIHTTACAQNKKTRYEAEFLILFDTLTKIVAYADSREEFTQQSQMIYDDLKIYHELYDIYNDYPGINNIKTINDNAGVKPVKVDKKIIDLLAFAKEGYEKTGGRMNIAMGAVLRIWHDYREAGLEDEDRAEIPPLERLQEAAKHTDINKMIIDDVNSTVFLEDPEMSLDVGSVGKGYAVERVAQFAMENGFTDGLISVGGNVRAMGYKGEDKQLWNLGIQNPDRKSEKTNLHIVNLTDASVVTSGDYDRFYVVDGKRYHHIIDPETLFPSEYFTAVTIICQHSGLADVLTTAIFNMPLEEGRQMIDSLPDIEALWVMKNGKIEYSRDFKKFIKE